MCSVVLPLPVPVQYPVLRTGLGWGWAGMTKNLETWETWPPGFEQEIDKTLYRRHLTHHTSCIKYLLDIIILREE